MNIDVLWKNYKFPNCENCKKDCAGHLDYDNLCSNLNYLYEYGEKNFTKNKDSFLELKKIIGAVSPTIFSFGCGIGLDYLGAIEVFGEKIKYYGIDECDWAIAKTSGYKNFDPKLPKTIKFDVGTFLLGGNYDNLVLCFFNSLFTISENTDLEKRLLETLKNKDKFYFVCDYTINSNFHMPTVEQHFIDRLIRKLRTDFSFNRFEILDGKGIIVVAKKK